MRFVTVSLWLFGLLLLSGLALMGWYVPVAGAAGAGGGSPAVSVGGILRGVHFWLAQAALLISLLIAIVAIIAAIFTKTNWLRAGWAAGAFVLTGLFWLTGMLLPWDQLDYWLAPVFRPPSGLFAVYWLHTLILAVPMLALLIIYVRRLRKT